MDFFEVAKQMETESRKFYEEQAAKSAVVQLKGVFGLLAKEEQRHYELFSGMQNKSYPTPVRDAGILTRAKDVFAKANKAFDTAVTVNDVENALRHALDKEKQAVAFYSGESLKISDARIKGDLVLIIDQEKQHVRLIDNLIEFSRRPKQWVENAEFVHLDEY